MLAYQYGPSVQDVLRWLQAIAAGFPAVLGSKSVVECTIGAFRSMMHAPLSAAGVHAGNCRHPILESCLHDLRRAGCIS